MVDLNKVEISNQILRNPFSFDSAREITYATLSHNAIKTETYKNKHSEQLFSLKIKMSNIKNVI